MFFAQTAAQTPPELRCTCGTLTYADCTRTCTRRLRAGGLSEPTLCVFRCMIDDECLKSLNFGENFVGNRKF